MLFRKFCLVFKSLFSATSQGDLLVVKSCGVVTPYRETYFYCCVSSEASLVLDVPTFKSLIDCLGCVSRKMTCPSATN